MESTVKIKGMSCQHCVMSVTKTINSIEGVSNVKVDLGKQEASFSHDSPVDLNDLRQKIEKAGFEIA